MLKSPISGLIGLLCFMGPYLMLYAWANRFFIRMLAGFAACSMGIAQFAFLLLSDSITMNSSNPFGIGDSGERANDNIAMVITCGIVGALFSGFSKTVGFFCLNVWGAMSLLTFIIVYYEKFQVASLTVDQVAPLPNTGIIWLVVLAVPCALVMVLHLFCKPGRVHTVLGVTGAFFGAAFGSHSVIQGIFSLGGSEAAECSLHQKCMEQHITGLCCEEGKKLACCSAEDWNGLNIANRQLWCSDEAECKLVTTTFFALMAISLVAQFCISGTEREVPKSKFTTASTRGAWTANYGAHRDGAKWNSYVAGLEQGVEEANWRKNVSTPRLTKFFLLCVLVMSCMFIYPTATAIDWTASSYTMGLFYVSVQTFTLWSVVEFCVLTIFFHFIRLIFDLPRLRRKLLREGLPREARTILAYCLLSTQESSSKESFRVACEAHLANLDPNGRITTSIVSVSSLLSVVQRELEYRDSFREEIRTVLLNELDVVLREQQAGRLEEDRGMKTLAEALDCVRHNTPFLGPKQDGHVRARFWYQLVKRAQGERGGGARSLRELLKEKVQSECVAHFIYLHRNCKILKKPGQYQDLMVLGSTGSNSAYTYLSENYGNKGREAGSDCFGFDESNVVRKDEENWPREEDISSDEVFNGMLDELRRRGKGDIDLVASLGSDPDQRYHYTMVLDSDTVCPARSIRSLVEVAEHESNARHGIINASLLHDFSHSECSWHMWRSALVEVSKVNLLRGQYAIYDRVGFYGKGLMRNDMYINRVIGTPGHLCEALPVEILSHDTVEAKLMHPCVAYEVVLFEDVARNPISALSQSTRWLLGEVRNSTYHDGPYKFLIRSGERFHSKVVQRKRKEFAYVRWTDVPCSLGAEYLSHIGFRGFHAGPMIMALNLLGILSSFPPTSGFLKSEDDRLKDGKNISVLFFVIVVLFIMPNAFMLLGYIPSLKLGAGRRGTAGPRSVSEGRGARDLEQPMMELSVTGPLPTRTASFSEMSLESADHSVLSCWKKLVLILLEIVLSVILYAPEQVEGVLRMSRSAWAQISGSNSWVPQEKVEKEVEERLSQGAGPALRYAIGTTWQVSVVGAFMWAFMIAYGAWNEFWVIMATVWVLHPLTTYWLCMPFPEKKKSSWMWRWTMDLRDTANRQYEF